MATAKPRPVPRGRNWAFLIYQDHLDRIGGYDHLRDWLLAQHVPAIVSPCHDQDEYDEDSISAWVERHRGKDGRLSDEDERRKPKVGDKEPAHYHVMLSYKGNKTMAGVLKQLKDGLGVWYVMRVEDKQAMMRYFCHLDQPTKHQYHVEDACTLNGMDRTSLYELSTIDKVGAVVDVCRYIKSERCVYFCDLVDNIIEAQDVATLQVVIEKYGFIDRYQSSYAERVSAEARKDAYESIRG